MFWTTAAYAMGGAPPGGADGAAGGLGAFVPLILMFAVFYFLLIRPQQKRAKEHKNMLAAIKRGDEVVTAGGLYGRVLETADDHLIVDLGDTKVKVSRAAISAVVGSSKIVEKKSRKGEGKPEEKPEKQADDKGSEEGAPSEEEK